MDSLEKLISVIVPVYNVEKYLCRCVDSILNQTYPYLEIILVDDGSTDNSVKICDEYAKKDSRIKVIHKRNGGVSSARNVGLQNVTGEFVTFVDSDDYLESTCLEKMHNGMIKSNVDLVVVRWKNQDGIIKIGNTDETFKEKMINQGQLPTIGLLTTVWGHLYRKKQLADISFDEEIFYGEDNLFSVNYFFSRNGKKMLLINEPLYIYYEDRVDAATNQRFNRKMLSEIEAVKRVTELIQPYQSLTVALNKYKREAYVKIFFKLVLSDEKKCYFKEYKYLKKEIIMLRRQGFKPSNRKENLIEILYLYFFWIFKYYIKHKYN